MNRGECQYQWITNQLVRPLQLYQLHDHELTDELLDKLGAPLQLLVATPTTCADVSRAVRPQGQVCGGKAALPTPVAACNIDYWPIDAAGA